MADGPICKKHNIARVATQTGKKKLWVLACPKCQAEKASAPSTDATPPTKPPKVPTPPSVKEPDAAPPPPEKKTPRYEKGLFFSRRIPD
jgi:hypothetical protein